MIHAYVSIDLETTGLNPKRDRIIEIGAVKVIDGQAAGTYSTLVNPGRKLDERIVELTGIRDEELAGAPYVEQVLPQVMDFLEELPLLGHSVLFDYSFLKKAAVDCKLSFERQGIDTLKIARRYLDKLEHRSLDYLCGYYQIPHHAHRALADAEAASILFHKLAEHFLSGEDVLFEPEPLHYKAKRDTPATNSQKERLYRLLEQHKISLDVDVERLARSEASRLTDKIFAEYGR